MERTDASPPETRQYQTEVKQLLDILAHSLYTEKEIFLRELISNASDALNRVQFEMLTNDDVVGADSELAIYLIPDAAARTLTVKDTGVGMNREELIANLGTIAHSGAKAFLAGAEAAPNSLDEIIGQFGVGFYSAFMVAQEVRVTSRSMHPDDRAWTWISRGESDYELRPADKADRGTEIEIQLKEGSDLTDGWRLQEIVKTHSDYVSFPIYLVEPATPPAAETETTDETETAEAEPADETETMEVETEAEAGATTATRINRQTALWRQNPNAVKPEEYEQFFGQLVLGGGEPLVHVHLVTDSPVDVRAVLFIPAQRAPDLFDLKRDEGLRLYSRKILIQKRNKDMLPEYMRFVEGVIDSEDLPLNVSRETIQENPMTRQISSALATRVLRALARTATTEPEKYATFWSQYGMFVKGGLAMDPERRDQLVALLRFQSTRSDDGFISLDDYIERMPARQKVVYYVEGRDLEAAKRSPHLDYFLAHDIEVLYFCDPVADTYVVVSLPEHREHKLVNVDGAEVDVPAKEPDAPAEDPTAPAHADMEPLVARVKRVLGEQVQNVQTSSLLVKHPSRLVYQGEDMARAFNRMSRLMGQEAETPKRVLELNPNHVLIQNMAAMQAADPANPLLDLLIEQVMDNALLLENLHPDPAGMTERLLSIMQAAASPKS